MKKKLLNEVKQFQKIAGIKKQSLNEGLRVFDDEGDSILEFTDVFTEEELERKIREKEKEDPKFAQNYDNLIQNSESFLEPVSDEDDEYESTYVKSFDEFVDDIVHFFDDEEVED